MAILAGGLAMPDPWAERRAEIARTLDRLGLETGDVRFRHAAGVLRGGKAGRRPRDDDAALALAESWLAAGLAPTRNAACLRAAQYYAPPQQIEATRARLMRKFRTKLNKSVSN